MARMQQYRFLPVLIVVLGLAFPFSCRSQDKSPNEPKLYRLIPAEAPKTGYRAEFLAEISYYEQCFTQLADAIPAEKYSWRPADGTRTFGEILAHVAVMNALSRRSLEEPLKPGVFHGISNEQVVKNGMEMANDKGKVVQALKTSFASLRQEVLLLSDAEADSSKKIFGTDTTVRGAMFLVTQNLGEQLGQLIAYGRMNGVASLADEKNTSGQ